MAEQGFKNHARFDPKFHFFYVPLAMACFVASIFHVVHQPTPPNVLLVPVSFCLVLGGLIARMYSLQVQDRVIRLEETLRLQRLGGSADGLTMRQLVGLRFASDGEVVALAARAKAEGMDGKQIKAAVVQWRADTHRV